MSTGEKQESSTRQIGNRALWIIGIGLLVIALAVFVYLGYHFRWRWTGFPQKRLFDWIQILVIPVAVAIGTFVLNRAAKRRDDEAQKEQRKRDNEAQREQREREQAIETERAEEASLQAYLDYMSGLLTDPDRPLRRTHLNDTLSVAARAQTLTALGRLQDGNRKGSAIQFLYEAGLINNHPVISLKGVDLRNANLRNADLRNADLYRANLQGADLFRANLKGANLIRANLKEAKLYRADFQEARLPEADFQEANLYTANLKGAYLVGADLKGANLSGAENLTQDQIEQATGDKDTTLPEGIDQPESWIASTDE